MKALFVALLLTSAASASASCDVLSYDRNLPTEMAEVLNEKGYQVSYFDLENLYDTTVDASYSLKYQEIIRGAFGEPIYKIKFKGNGIKIKAKGLNISEVVKLFRAQLNTCS